MCFQDQFTDDGAFELPKTQQRLLVQQLRRQLRTARQQASKYRAMFRENRRLKQNLSTPDKIVEAASKYLKGTALDFFACQLKCAGRRSVGRRWTAEDKLLALSIFH